MELSLLEMILELYRVMAFFVLFAIAIGSVVLPVMLCAMMDHPLPLLLYLVAPIIIAMCYKLMCLM